MTKHDLKELRALKKEIEILQTQLNNINVQPQMVSDSVKGSLACFPYTEHTVKITGIDEDGYSSKRLSRIRIAIEQKRLEAINKIEEINQYIDSVEDPEIRNILRLRYVDCLTWEEIEEVLHMSKRTAQRKFNKWWDEN